MSDEVAAIETAYRCKKCSGWIARGRCLACGDDNEGVGFTLRPPWENVSDAQRLNVELARELCEGHMLYGRKVHAVARRIDQDDFLFIEGKEAFVVHLTWAKESDPAWPTCVRYGSVDLWVKNCMHPDADDYSA